RRLQAEPDERQGRDGEDRITEPDRRLDENRRHQVWEDLRENHVRRPPPPRKRPASTYSSCPSPSTAARTVRVMIGVNTIAMITATAHVDRLPSAATTGTARAITGIASTESVMRLIVSSAIPRK